jgi:hypothetical protein
MISAKDARERTTHFAVALKINIFSLCILHAKVAKSFSFPLHGSCTDVTDQSLTFLEMSILFGWEIRMFPVQTGFLYYFPVEISPRNGRRDERGIITTSGTRSYIFFFISVYPNGSIHPDGSGEMSLKELWLVTLIIYGG